MCEKTPSGECWLSQDRTLEENGVSRPSPGPSLVMQSSIPLAEMSNSKNKPGDLEAQQDQDSVLSGISKDTFEEERGVTCTDIKLIMPTVLILLFTLFIMVTVIPYAFSSVIKQLQAVWALEEQSNQFYLFGQFYLKFCFGFSRGRGGIQSIWT